MNKKKYRIKRLVFNILTINSYVLQMYFLQLYFIFQTLSGIGAIAPPWIPDGRVTMCQVCTSLFNVYNRRHHCRGCGKVSFLFFCIEHVLIQGLFIIFLGKSKFSLDIDHVSVEESAIKTRKLRLKSSLYKAKNTRSKVQETESI